MSLSTNILDYVQRFQDLQQQRDTSDQLIRDILMYCDKLETALRFQNQKLADELQDCKREKRDLQTQLQNIESQDSWVKEVEELRSQNQYVLVMIDGDGLVFRDQWIKQGVEGGKKAALALRSAVAEQCGDHADHIEVITKVVANFGGLAKTLKCDLSDLRDFALGFTKAKASFDFIDVGHGKHGTSIKIKDTVDWHMQNYNCRHVLLGIAHDASYGSFVDELLQDDTTSSRLTLIESTPAVPEIASKNVPLMNLGKDLFRNDKLSDKNAVVWPVGAWGAANPRTRTASPASVGSVSTPGKSSLSYASAISSGSPPPQITLPITPKPIARPKIQYQQIPPQQPDWNPGPRGLDEPITVSVTAMESIKKRKDNDKLCNNHFLRGPCSKGDQCFFVHDYKPTENEINAIAVLARQNPCTMGQDCDSDECIYGHHCPSIRDGVCGHPFCKFPEESHPPGTKFKNSSIKSN